MCTKTKTFMTMSITKMSEKIFSLKEVILPKTRLYNVLLIFLDMMILCLCKTMSLPYKFHDKVFMCKAPLMHANTF